MKTAVSLAAALAMLAVIGFAIADDEERPWHRTSAVAAPPDPLYKQECGDCHMAYPPGLLPARSWEAIMNGLEDHFGDNASLDAAVRAQVLDYLQRNSADRADYPRSRKIARQLAPDAVPLRITELPFFRHEHKELDTRTVQDNPDIGSFSRCNACHSGAESGSFSESGINVPGYGRWDD